MSNTQAEYKWQVVVQKIQEIESQIDLENKRADLYDRKNLIQIMMVVHTILEDLCQSKKKIVFSQCLSPTVHQLAKGFINWKKIYNQER